MFSKSILRTSLVMLFFGGIVFFCFGDEPDPLDDLKEALRDLYEETSLLETEDEEGWQTMENGLKIQILREGSSDPVESGDTVRVHYTGTFLDGKKFDSSLDRKDPFQFKVGAKHVISGWDLGVVGMKVGEIRSLYIPSDLAYGSRGAGGGVIPPNTDLLFEIELLEIK